MYTVNDVRKKLFEFAPADAKMDFDNVGLLVGDSRQQVKAVLVALDITSEVIEEARESGANLIVSHHPLLFSQSSVTNDNMTGRLIIKLVANGISAICMHTNLDAADGGVNDALAKTCGLTNVQLLENEGVYADGAPFSYGRKGNLSSEMPLRDYLPFLKTALKSNGLRFHSSGKPVSRVAVVGGSGGSYLAAAVKAGCDTLVTADVKYDVFLEAREMGINLIDADHFCTENTVIPELCGHLNKWFPEIICSQSESHGQTARFFV